MGGETDWRGQLEAIKELVRYPGVGEYRTSRQSERKGLCILQHTSGIFAVKYNNSNIYLQIKNHTYFKYMLRTKELMQQFLTSGDLESTKSLVTSICSPQTIALKTQDLLNISNSEKRRVQ